jgi:hypothetical protein
MLDAEQAYNALLHIVPAAMLFAALGHWPYSYYMLLRIVVMAAYRVRLSADQNYFSWSSPPSLIQTCRFT